MFAHEDVQDRREEDEIIIAISHYGVRTGVSVLFTGIC